MTEQSSQEAPRDKGVRARLEDVRVVRVGGRNKSFYVARLRERMNGSYKAGMKFLVPSEDEAGIHFQQGESIVVHEITKLGPEDRVAGLSVDHKAPSYKRTP